MALFNFNIGESRQEKQRAELLEIERQQRAAQQASTERGLQRALGGFEGLGEPTVEGTGGGFAVNLPGTEDATGPLAQQSPDETARTLALLGEGNFAGNAAGYLDRSVGALNPAEAEADDLALIAARQAKRQGEQGITLNDQAIAMNEAQINALTAPPAELTPGQILNETYAAVTGGEVPKGMRVVQSPSGELVPIPQKNTPEWKKDLAVVRASEGVVRDIRSFMATFDRVGPEVFDGPLANDLSEKRQAIINQLRTLENLGTPQAAELKALADRLPDPTAFFTAINPANRIWDERITAPYSVLRDKSELMLKQMRTDHFYIPGAVGID